MVEAGRLIVSAAPGIPVIGDGDTGYGNAVNVRRTVRGYRQAGMAGIIIEDQVREKGVKGWGKVGGVAGEGWGEEGVEGRGRRGMACRGRWRCPHIQVSTKVSEGWGRVCCAPGIPVIGDGDTGHGPRRVGTQQGAGWWGVPVPAWPKACGHTAGRRVVGRDEAVMRIRAAADERDEGQGDIVIVARSDACQAVSLDEALWRAAAFADAGADMVFIDALGSEEDMRAFVRAVPNTPKLINQLEGGGRTPILSPQQLEDMGFAIAVYPLSLVGVCTRAMQDALSALASGRLPRPSLLPPFEELKEAVGFPEYLALEERYKTVEDDDGSSWSTVAGIDLAGLVERAAARAQSEGGGKGDDEVVVVDFKDKTTGDRVRILLE
ncbi:unnamed protein product [Closterium sp. NIES-65]|nr:unnamed protein product [Closterium sp. NIES-65]